MKPSLVKESIRLSYKMKQPLFIWGSVGLGKSDCVKQVVIEDVLELLDLRAVLTNPAELQLPKINAKSDTVKWCVPDYFPTKGKGIMFLDELSAAPQIVQAMFYQLVLDRRLGDYHLPDDWHIIAAGNREQDKAVVNRMPSALANRFIHIEFEVDLNDWVNWALDNDIQPELVQFIRFRPNLLNAFDPKKNDKAFPTPRSWSFVSSILKNNTNPELEYELLSGTVGEGATAELKAYLDVYRSLPNPDLIILQPDKAEVPTDISTIYALCGALLNRAGENTIESIITYAEKMEKELNKTGYGGTEFGVMLITDCLRKQAKLASNVKMIKWISNHNYAFAG